MDVKQGTGTQSTVATLNFNSTSCTLSETLTSAPKRALAANANKIYSAQVLAAVAGTTGAVPAVVKQGSYATVVVTGNTGTIGSGPDANREINLTPVVYPADFSANAWKLVDVRFNSGNASCGSSGLIANQLHISTNTSPSSANCGGLYSAAFTFQSRATDESQVSEVQAFSYIASGNLIKHTSPYGSTIGLPTVNDSTGTATTAASVDLGATLQAAISSGAVSFTLDEVSLIAYQGQNQTSNTLTFLGGTGPIASLCLVNPANSSECTNGPYNVNNLKDDETTGTSIAGSFEIVTENSEPRIKFTASATYYIGGSNSTDLPARITMRAVDSSGTPQTSDAFANGTVLQGTAPTSSGDTQSGPLDQPLTLSVSGTGTSITKCIFASAPMPEPCSGTSVTQNGTWSLNAVAGTVTFTPTAGFTGTSVIKFGVTDQFGATSFSDLSATINSSPIFTLIFNANGATGTPPSNMTGNGPISLPNPADLQKADSVFDAWSTSTFDVDRVTSPFNLTTNTTLYALWAAAFTLTFDGNTPLSGSAPPAIVGTGNQVLPANVGSLSKTGFLFGGWSINGTTYQPGDTYPLSSSITATAVWIPEFTVTFDGNGEDSGSSPAQITGNGTVSLPGNSGPLVKSGFTFLGWALSSSATAALSSSYNLTANVTLYAVWQAVVSVAPTVQETDPCVPISASSTDGLYVELGLVGVISEIVAAGMNFLSNVVDDIYQGAINTEFGAAVAANQFAVVNFEVDPDTYGDILSGSPIFQALAKAAPKQMTQEEQIAPEDVTVVPGSEPNSVEIQSANGDPLELLAVQSIDLNLYAQFTGAELNNPKVWQDLGYGLQCWKLEPFVDTWFYLPASAQPPGAPAGTWRYSNVIVKAGSITADPTTFQANTLFASPNGGEMVWADVNGDGLYNPGGKTGDKAISHIVLCADLLLGNTPSPSTPSSPTPSVSATPTPTVTVSPTPTESASPTPTVTVTPTPSPTTTATPTPTSTPTLEPAPLPSPEPTTRACSTPTVAPPSTPPTPIIRILSLPTPTPSEPVEAPSPTPTPTDGPTASPTPTPTDGPTASPTPTPTDGPTASPTPTPTDGPTASPTPTPTDGPTASPTPTPTDGPTASPTPTPTDGPLARPSGPVPDPEFDPNPPLTCAPSEEFGVSFKLTNGLSTTCFRMTTESYLALSAFGGFEVIDDVELPAGQGGVDELADTGFETSNFILYGILMLSLGLALVLYARRRV